MMRNPRVSKNMRLSSDLRNPESRWQGNSTLEMGFFRVFFSVFERKGSIFTKKEVTPTA